MNDDEFAANGGDCDQGENDAVDGHDSHDSHDSRDSLEAASAPHEEDGHHDDDSLDTDLAARIEALPTSIEPPACLWADVAARIAADRSRKRVRRMRVAAAIGTFAIAASIAIGLGAHALKTRTMNATEARSGDAGPSPSSSAAALNSASRAIIPDPSVPALLPEEPAYRAAAQALRASLTESRGAIPAKGKRCIDDDLRVLDSAIDATRGALAKSPDDQVLRAALRDAYQQEIDVLADVIDLTSRS